jgi:hypothetical protein
MQSKLSGKTTNIQNNSKRGCGTYRRGSIIISSRKTELQLFQSYEILPKE